MSNLVYLVTGTNIKHDIPPYIFGVCTSVQRAEELVRYFKSLEDWEELVITYVVVELDTHDPEFPLV